VFSGIAHGPVKWARPLPQLGRHSPTQIRPPRSETLGYRSYPETVNDCGEPRRENGTDKRHASSATVAAAHVYAKTYAGTRNYLSKPTSNHPTTTIDWSVSWTATDTDFTYTVTRTATPVLTATRPTLASTTNKTDALT